MATFVRPAFPGSKTLRQGYTEPAGLGSVAPSFGSTRSLGQSALPAHRLGHNYLKKSAGDTRGSLGMRLADQLFPHPRPSSQPASRGERRSPARFFAGRAARLHKCTRPEGRDFANPSFREIALIPAESTNVFWIFSHSGELSALRRGRRHWKTLASDAHRLTTMKTRHD